MGSRTGGRDGPLSQARAHVHSLYSIEEYWEELSRTRAGPDSRFVAATKAYRQLDDEWYDYSLRKAVELAGSDGSPRTGDPDFGTRRNGGLDSVGFDPATHARRNVAERCVDRLKQ